MSKKGKIENTILKVVEKVVRQEVIKNQEEWPPHCWGILHQPKRPKKKD